MFGYKQKSELCKRVVELYLQIPEEQDRIFCEKYDIHLSRAYRERTRSTEEWYARRAYDYEKLSRSPRLLFVRKSTLEERVKSLEDRLEEIRDMQSK